MKSAATYAGDPRHHHSDLTELRAEVERLKAENDRLRFEMADHVRRIVSTAVDVPASTVVGEPWRPSGW